MNITMREDKSLEVETNDKIQESLDMFEVYKGEKINEKVTSPAQKHLRNVDDKCEPLGKT